MCGKSRTSFKFGKGSQKAEWFLLKNSWIKYISSTHDYLISSVTFTVLQSDYYTTGTVLASVRMIKATIVPM